MTRLTLTIVILSLGLSSARAQQLVLDPRKSFSKPLAGSKLARLRVPHLPLMGWDQQTLRPTDPKVRAALTGVRLGTPGFGSLDRPDAGVRRRNTSDGLLLTNGSILVPLIGREVRYVGAKPEARFQPYAEASVGYLGGYLALPKSLGKSGIAGGPQASAKIGLFVGRNVQVEYGVQALSRMKGVRLNSTTLSIKLRI